MWPGGTKTNMAACARLEEPPGKNPLATQYERDKGTVDVGRELEDAFSAAVLSRALRLAPAARLAVNATFADKFDDVVAALPGSEPLVALVQLKSTRVVTRKHLEAPTGNFALATYEKSFLKLSGSAEFWERMGAVCQCPADQMDKLKKHTFFVFYTTAAIHCRLVTDGLDPRLAMLLTGGGPGCLGFVDPKSVKGNLSEEFLQHFVVYASATVEEAPVPVRGPAMGKGQRREEAGEEAAGEEKEDPGKAAAGNARAMLDEEVARRCGLVAGLREATTLYLRAVTDYNRLTGDGGVVPFLDAASPTARRLREVLGARTRAPHGVRCRSGSAPASAASELLWGKLGAAPKAPSSGKKEKKKKAPSSAWASVASVVLGGSCAQLRSCVVGRVAAGAGYQEPFFADARDSDAARAVVALWRRSPPAAPLLLEAEGVSLDTLGASTLRDALLEAVAAAPPRRVVLLSATAGAWLARELSAHERAIDLSFADLDDDSQEELMGMQVVVQEWGAPRALSSLCPREALAGLGPEGVSWLLRPGAAPSLGRAPAPLLRPTLRVGWRIADACLQNRSLRDVFVLENLSLEELRGLVPDAAKIGDLDSASPDHTYRLFSHFKRRGKVTLEGLQKKLRVPGVHWLFRHNKAFLWKDTAGTFESLLPYAKQPYQKRTLQADIRLNEEFFGDASQDIFVIEGVRRTDLEDLVHNRNQIGDLLSKYPGDKYRAIKDFQKASLTLEKLQCFLYQRITQDAGNGRSVVTIPNVHLVSRQNDGFLWRGTAGDTSNILKYASAKDIPILTAFRSAIVGDEELISTGLPRVAVSAAPGMGKSALLQRVVEHLRDSNPGPWLVAFSLPEVCRELGQRVGLQETLARAAGILSQPDMGARAVASAALNHAILHSGGAAVVVDAVDEVAPDYVDAARQLLEELAQSRAAPVWAASRPATRGVVEALLCSRERHAPGALRPRAFVLRPLAPRQQEEALVAAWTGAGAVATDLKRRAKQLIQMMQRNQPGNEGAEEADEDKDEEEDSLFTGVPLNVFLLALATRHAAEQDKRFVDAVKNLSLYDVYTTVVNDTIKRFQDEKGNGDMDRPSIRHTTESLRDGLMQGYMVCALSVVLSQVQIASLGITDLAERQRRFAERMADAREKAGFVVEVVEGRVLFAHRTFAEYFVACWMADNWQSNREVVLRLVTTATNGGVQHFFDFFLAKDCPVHVSVLNGSILHRTEKRVNGRDKAGRTPLHLAAQGRSCKVVKFLVYQGSQIEATDGLLDMTPLEYAARAQRWKNVRMLQKRGAQVRGNVATLPLVQEMLRTKGVEPRFPAFAVNWPFFPGGRTILHLAVHLGDEACVAELLRHGADINAADCAGCCPIHEAALERRSSLFKFLAGRGANLQAPLFGSSAIQIAVDEGCVTASEAEQLLQLQ